MWLGTFTAAISALSILLQPVFGNYDYLHELSPPCNPMEDPTCIARDKALATSLYEPFTSKSQHFKVFTCPSGVSYCEHGARLTISERYDNPSIVSNFYILYGRVEVEIKAAHGTGIISSFYLQSDVLDEIDVAEVFGGDIYEFQSNYFVRGNTTTYDRGGYHPMAVPPMNEFHKYSVDWTPERIEWKLNGQTVRILNKDNSQGFPDSPMFIKFRLWAGGDPDNEQGTVEWAGGLTNYQTAPFSMYIKNLNVLDYSTGTEYAYGNAHDGTWIDLTARKGVIFDQPSDATPIPKNRNEDTDKQIKVPLSFLDENHDNVEYDIEYEIITDIPSKDHPAVPTIVNTNTNLGPDGHFVQFFNRTMLNATANSMSQISASLMKLIYTLALEGLFILLCM
ncbi:concanavalin A-like lectin/glucanase domain-containing protein [Scheffersomyces xylosifermentans]|uniref:concanavalin A-like lectin/glucanase domain-containing protein n=1 Tax=Scheffersomyces xylosifermentans TaxID=1304137 RepID=UPI00315C4C82